MPNLPRHQNVASGYSYLHKSPPQPSQTQFDFMLGFYTLGFNGKYNDNTLNDKETSSEKGRHFTA